MKRTRSDLSPWFFDRNPDMPGVYRRFKLSVPPVFAKWDGKKWYCCAHTVEKADAARETSVVQHTLGGWCGLVRRITW